MAPFVQKRRRPEDDAARPKKKFKKISKQKWYHSSSEEEEDMGENEHQQRASDAPRPKSAMIVDSITQDSDAPKPKSILKQELPASAPTALHAEGTEEALDEVEKNTALNAANGYASEDDDLEEQLDDYEPNIEDAPDTDEESVEDDSDSRSEASTTSSQVGQGRKKRNDPEAFATSISKILGTKLSNAKRQDPVLSRSRSAAEANQSIADDKLEQKARAQIRAEKKQALEKGRVKDVLGLETPEVDTGAVMEEEKRLKKTAQRGVVKLFNAVRGAQVKAEETLKQAKSEGIVGMRQREEKVNEMSKQGFLELISSGGKRAPVSTT